MQEIRSFKNIQDAVIDRAKLEGSSADVIRQIKEKINTTYTRIVYEDFYTWSGETRIFPLPKKYATGTITVTQGSDIITGASTVWTENDHLNLKMKIAGDSNPFKIIRVASNTSITLDHVWTGATTSSLAYEIYQDDFGLFPDCQAVRKITINGYNNYRQPLPISPTEFEEHRARSPFSGGQIQYYTVWGQSHYRGKTWATFNIDVDFWEDSLSEEPKNLNLMVYPSLRVNDLFCNVRYTKIACPMDADTDEPIIPFYNREILVWGTLLDHFSQNRDVQMIAMWKGRYDDIHKKMQAQIESYEDQLIIIADNRKYGWTGGYYRDDK